VTNISQGWKVITIISTILLIVSGIFAYTRWANYQKAINYFGESPYNEQYWLHPQNKWVESVEYSTSGSGLVSGAKINEDDTTTVNYYSAGKTSETNLIRNGKFFFANRSEFPAETTYERFGLALAVNKQFAYTCNGQTLEFLFCYYFIND